MFGGYEQAPIYGPEIPSSNESSLSPKRLDNLYG